VSLATLASACCERNSQSKLVAVDRVNPLTDTLRLLVSLFAASLIHGVALSHGFSFASAVTGDIDASLRPLIVAQP
jgi:hypothetical protein